MARMQFSMTQFPELEELNEEHFDEREFAVVAAHGEELLLTEVVEDQL